MKTIQELLEEVDRNELLLPEFQRGYVWNRKQVRALIQSLYRGLPSGHLLVWSTYKPSPVRGGTPRPDGHSLLLLDGQQRLTTLYVLFRGQPPRFYEGESLYFDLFFNVQTEEFRFWQKSQMANNPAWIRVPDLLKETLNSWLGRLDEFDEDRRTLIQNNLARFSRLDQIRTYSYTVDKVSGDDYGVNEVVEVFNRLNKAGTTLTKSDLALAHVCSIWPEARAEMRSFRDDLRRRDFDFDFDFLVRCLAGVTAGSILLEGAFFKTPADDLKSAWNRLVPSLERLVSVLRAELCVADTKDIPSTRPLLVATVFLARHAGNFPTDELKRRFLRWISLACLWSRYSGASETALQQDVACVTRDSADPTIELEDAIRRQRGRVTLSATDLEGARIGSAVTLLSQVVARFNDARDWFTGSPLYDRVIQSASGRERHYIFPRSVLAQVGVSDSTLINECANRAFLAHKVPRQWKSASPAEYLGDVQTKQPGALEAQSVPVAPDLWKPENYERFLRDRRRRLASAMNVFLDSWLPPTSVDNAPTIPQLIEQGESSTVEFKSSLRWDLRERRVNKEIERAVVRTVAGLLNASGGTLLIGVNDDGRAVGLSQDYATLPRSNRDGFEVRLRQLLDTEFGVTIASGVTVTFHDIEGADVCYVAVGPSQQPVWVEYRGDTVFYLRIGNATKKLAAKDAVEYIGKHWQR